MGGELALPMFQALLVCLSFFCSPGSPVAEHGPRVVVLRFSCLAAHGILVP